MDFFLTISSRYKTICSAYLSRATVLICKFISLPLLLFYLPREEYALFVILTGLEGWFLLFDFGVGTALQNTLAENEIKGEKEGSFLKTSLLINFFSLSLGGLFVWQLFPFFSLFLTNKIGIFEKLKPIFLPTGFFFLLNAWGSIGGKVLLAKEKGYQMYLTQSIAHLVSLACLTITGIKGGISLPVALFCTLGIPSVATSLLTIKIFSKVDFKGSFQWDLFKRAWKFWLFALMAAFVSLSDSLVITVTLSLEEIVEYNVLCKIFGIASFAYGAFIQGVMPECTQSLLLKKVKEVENLIYRHCFISILGVFLFTSLVWIMAFYLNQSFKVDLGLLAIISFGVYLCIRVVADFFAMALQSHSKLRSFFYLVPVQAVLSLTLQYILSIQFGVGGILMGLSLSYLLTVCWALPKKLKGLKRVYE